MKMYHFQRLENRLYATSQYIEANSPTEAVRLANEQSERTPDKGEHWSDTVEWVLLQPDQLEPATKDSITSVEEMEGGGTP